MRPYTQVPTDPTDVDPTGLMIKMVQQPWRLGTDYRGFIDEFSKSWRGTSMSMSGALTSTTSTLLGIGQGALQYGEAAIGRRPFWAVGRTNPKPSLDKSIEDQRRFLDKWGMILYEDAQSERYSPAKDGGLEGYLANVTGSILPFIGAVMAAGAVSGGSGAFLMASSVEGGSQKLRALQNGADMHTAEMEGLMVGTINGVIEFMQIAGVLRFAKGGSKAARELAKEAQKRAWKKMLAKGGQLTTQHLIYSINEGIEESLQTLSSEYGATIHGEKPQPGRALGAGVRGAVGYGITGGLGRLGVAAGTKIEQAIQQKETIVRQVAPKVRAKHEYEAAMRAFPGSEGLFRPTNNPYNRMPTEVVARHATEGVPAAQEEMYRRYSLSDPYEVDVLYGKVAMQKALPKLQKARRIGAFNQLAVGKVKKIPGLEHIKDTEARALLKEKDPQAQLNIIAMLMKKAPPRKSVGFKQFIEAPGTVAHGTDTAEAAGGIVKEGLRPGSSVGASWAQGYPIVMLFDKQAVGEGRTVEHHPDHKTVTGSGKPKAIIVFDDDMIDWGGTYAELEEGFARIYAEAEATGDKELVDAVAGLTIARGREKKAHIDTLRSKGHEEWVKPLINFAEMDQYIDSFGSEPDVTPLSDQVQKVAGDVPVLVGFRNDEGEPTYVLPKGKAVGPRAAEIYESLQYLKNVELPQNALELAAVPKKKDAEKHRRGRLQANPLGPTEDDFRDIRRFTDDDEEALNVLDHLGTMVDGRVSPDFKEELMNLGRWFAHTRRQVLRGAAKREALGMEAKGQLPEWPSLEKAMMDLEARTGLPTSGLSRLITRAANKAGISMAEQLHAQFDQAGIPAAHRALFFHLTVEQNNALADYLHDEDEDSAQRKFANLDSKTQKVATALDNYLLHDVGPIIRGLRWKIMDRATRRYEAAVRRVRRSRAGESAKLNKLRRLKEDYEAEWAKRMPDVTDVTERARILQQGRAAQEVGQFREWLDSEKFGVRKHYYMSEASPETFEFALDKMAIPEEMIDEVRTAKMGPGDAIITPGSTIARQGEGEARRGPVIRNVLLRAQRLNILLETSDHFENMVHYLNKAKLSIRDIGNLRNWMDHTRRFYARPGSFVDLVRKGNNLFWKTHFIRPTKVIWFALRQMLQNLAYAPSQLNIPQLTKSTAELLIGRVRNRVPQFIQDALDEEWEADISQKRVLWHGFMLQDQAELAQASRVEGRLKADTNRILDILGQVAPLTDEINRFAIYPGLAWSAYKDGMKVQKGEMSPAAIKRRLKIGSMHPVAQARLLGMLASGRVEEFAKEYASLKVRNIHGRYANDLRNLVAQQGMGHKLAQGLLVFPQISWEIVKYNTVRPLIAGFRTGNIALLKSGMGNMINLLVGTTAASEIAWRVLGKRAYGLIRTWGGYTPIAPGPSIARELADSISYTIRMSESDKPIVDIAKGIGGAAGSRLVNILPFAELVANAFEARGNVKGASAWRLLHKSWVERNEIVHKKSFSEVERTEYQKWVHTFIGGFEDPEMQKLINE